MQVVEKIQIEMSMQLYAFLRQELPCTYTSQTQQIIDHPISNKLQKQRTIITCCHSALHMSPDATYHEIKIKFILEAKERPFKDLETAYTSKESHKRRERHEQYFNCSRLVFKLVKIFSYAFFATSLRQTTYAMQNGHILVGCSLCFSSSIDELCSPTTEKDRDTLLHKSIWAQRLDKNQIADFSRLQNNYQISGHGKKPQTQQGLEIKTRMLTQFDDTTDIPLAKKV